MSEWIRVDDEMPEEYQDVLVTDGDYDSLWTYPGNCVRGLETHWQPLPEPPQ